MGLSVRVYKHIEPTDSEEEYDFIAYVIDKNWKHKIKNLNENQKYNGESQATGVNYAYSTHGRFREYLIKLISCEHLLDEEGRIKWSELEKSTEIPFYELINFADNEGCIDWEISEKLYSQFKEFSVANSFNEEDYFSGIYEEWKHVFEIAKEKGVVVFS